MTAEFGRRVAFLARLWAWARLRVATFTFPRFRNYENVTNRSGVLLFRSLSSSPQTLFNLLELLLRMCHRHKEASTPGLILKEVDL